VGRPIPHPPQLVTVFHYTIDVSRLFVSPAMRNRKKHRR